MKKDEGEEGKEKTETCTETFLISNIQYQLRRSETVGRYIRQSKFYVKLMKIVRRENTTPAERKIIAAFGFVLNVQ